MRIDGKLTLRSFRPSDREDLVAALNNWAVTKWLLPVPHPYRLDHADRFLAEPKNDGVYLAVCENDRVIGGVQCNGVRELGFWLAESHWGQGIMYRAAQTVTKALMPSCQGDAMLTSSALEDNVRSQALIRKLGFVKNGERTQMSVPLQREVRLINFRK